MSLDTATTPSPESEPAPPPPRSDDDRVRLVAGLVALGAVFLLVVAIVAVVRQGTGDDDADAATASEDGDDWGGTLLGSAQPRPEFTLTDTEGRPFDFAAETQGRLTMLFFGYTNCPDVCPIQMAVLAGALESPGMPEATVVVVTTDPARDTPERLREWLDQYDSSFVGLTGTPEEIAQAEDAAEVARSLPEANSDTDDDYLVGHAAQVITYTPDDLAHVVHASGVRQQDWTADLPRMMEQWGSGGHDRTGQR